MADEVDDRRSVEVLEEVMREHQRQVTLALRLLDAAHVPSAQGLRENARSAMFHRLLVQLLRESCPGLYVGPEDLENDVLLRLVGLLLIERLRVLTLFIQVLRT